MTGLEYMLSLHEVCCFQSQERGLTGPASNSEVRRWLDHKNALRINGEQVRCQDKIKFPIKSVVLFKRERTVTIL